MKTASFISIALISALTWQGCESEETPGPVDCTENPVQLSVVSVENTNCNQSDGSVEVTATGGAGGYQYSMEGGPLQTSSVFSDVAAGIYEITAEDANDCTATIEVTVTNVNGLNISFETSPAGCEQSAGSITVTATNGTEPYQYKLDNGGFGSDNTFATLSAGEHNLVVTDASGCMVNQTVTIASGISFSASISPIISSKCAINTCHNGTQFPDFRVFKNIHDNAAQIKTLTGNGMMPEDGSLTQAQIDMIACWVDDGALNN